MENQSIIFEHFRHATSRIVFGEIAILIDPMLASKETLPAVPLASNSFKNPLIDLPFTSKEIIEKADVLLLSHLHFDHFDLQAITLIPKGTNVLCASFDKKKLEKYGFKNINVIDQNLDYKGISFTQFPAIHGKGLFKYLMGKGSSYLLEQNGFKLFLTGDCLLIDSLKENLKEIKPDVVIVNAGAARFIIGQPITMSIKDVIEIAELLKESKIIVVHLDVINHCSESREFCVEQTKNIPSILIPKNGETFILRN